VVGNGDSLCAAYAAESLFKDFTAIRCRIFPAFKYLQYDLPVNGEGPVMVAGVSASGSSRLIAEILNRAALTPGVLTVAVTGTSGSPVEKAAAYKVDASVMELGRIPGLRTYAASITGLSALALHIRSAVFSIADAELGRGSLIRQLRYLGDQMPELLPRAETAAKEMAFPLGASFVSLAGSGPGYGSALFAAAKFSEISGIFSSAQDLEEWLHVESLACPGEYPLVLFAPAGPGRDKAIEVAAKAKAGGHRVMIITGNAANIRAHADVLALMPPVETDYLSPLVDYIVPALAAAAAAERLGRGMFQT
jgi:glucosamine--fructose-6-phosphate aminotransferase (isomerizing)